MKKKTKQTYEVFVVEDHPAILQSYAFFLDDEEGLTLSGSAASVDEAIQQLSTTTPAMVIVDIALEGRRTGIELVRYLDQHLPDLPTLVVSGQDGAFDIRRAREAGAEGFLSKHRAAEHFIEAIWQVLSGSTYFDNCSSRAAHSNAA